MTNQFICKFSYYIYLFLLRKPLGILAYFHGYSVIFLFISRHVWISGIALSKVMCKNMKILLAKKKNKIFRAS